MNFIQSFLIFISFSFCYAQASQMPCPKTPTKPARPQTQMLLASPNTMNTAVALAAMSGTPAKPKCNKALNFSNQADEQLQVTGSKPANKPTILFHAVQGGSHAHLSAAAAAAPQTNAAGGKSAALKKMKQDAQNEAARIKLEQQITALAQQKQFNLQRSGWMIDLESAKNLIRMELGIQ